MSEFVVRINLLTEHVNIIPTGKRMLTTGQPAETFKLKKSMLSILLKDPPNEFYKIQGDILAKKFVGFLSINTSFEKKPKVNPFFYSGGSLIQFSKIWKKANKKRLFYHLL